MNVTDFLARLSYGPLSNLSMSNDGDGTIEVARHPAIVSYLNEVLLKLFTKFDLLEKEVIIQQSSAITKYRLHTDYAVSNPLSDPTYITDSVGEPFLNDLIKIYAVYNADAERLPLNDSDDSRSVFTPEIDVLQVPEPIDGSALYILFQARHPVLSADELTDTVSLPAVLEEAAIAYVAHKVYFYRNGQENTAKAAELLATYEKLCAEVITNDLVGASISSTGSKFSERGFC